MSELTPSRRWRLAAIVLSAAWIVLAGGYGLMQARTKAHRDVMFCFRMQATARSAPQCSSADAGKNDLLCRWKDTTCTTSLRPYRKELAAAGVVALVPPALIWKWLLCRERRRRGAAV